MNDNLFNMTPPDGHRYIPEKPLPHNRTETSMKAANAQTFNKVAKDRNAIMNLAIRRGGRGIIRADCELLLGMASGTYCARINDLVNELELIPKLDEDGEKVKRKTPRRTPASVLIARQFATQFEVAAAAKEVAEKAAKRRRSA